LYARGETIEKGRIYTTEFVSDDDTLSWVDRESQSSEEHILLFSRLPHRRLLEHIDINAVEAYWLSERATEGAIRPDISEIRIIIMEHLSHHAGTVILEGLEWLMTINGEDVVLSFIRELREAVYRTQWVIIIPIRSLAFEALWLARLRREAPSLDLSLPKTDSESESNIDSRAVEDSDYDSDLNELDIMEDDSPQLVMLSRLPSSGFTNALLRKRILQWRRMGLDVSEVEAALSFQPEEAYALYAVVEEKVRRAVELEQHLNRLATEFSATDEATARFRIRQLTGLDELERLFFGD
jgi:hypothetical protein